MAPFWESVNFMSPVKSLLMAQQSPCPVRREGGRQLSPLAPTSHSSNASNGAWGEPDQANDEPATHTAALSAGGIEKRQGTVSIGESWISGAALAVRRTKSCGRQTVRLGNGDRAAG